MLVEALTLMTLYMQPSKTNVLNLTPNNLPYYPTFISQPLTNTLEKAWKEFRASEIIESSA